MHNSNTIGLLIAGFLNYTENLASMAREADSLVNGGCNYRGLGGGEREDRGNDARITSNYPGDYLFMMNPVSRKMESSSGSGCNVICVYFTYSMQKV